MLTVERLRQVLTYDPATGIFRWAERRGRFAAGTVAGCLNVDGYWVIRVDYVLYYAHRLAHFWIEGCWPSDQIDHENLNKSDFRWANLRDATGSQNHGNMAIRADNSSGFKGVSFDKKRKKWDARLRHQGKQIHLGRFSSPESAHEAYSSAHKRLFGEYSRTT